MSNNLTPQKLKAITDFNYDGYIFAKGSVNAQLLAGMPRRRQVQFPDNDADYSRTQSVEAYIAQEVGEAQRQKCTRCAAGKGQFAREKDSCVTVAGFLKGACASCHHGTGGKDKCTFYGANASSSTSARSSAAPQTPTTTQKALVAAATSTTGKRSSHTRPGSFASPPPKRLDFGDRKLIEQNAADDAILQQHIIIARGMTEDALLAATKLANLQKKAYRIVMLEREEDEDL